MGPIFLRHQPFQNRILSALPEEELQQLRPYLSRVRLVPGQILIDHQQQASHVFFIEEGIVSVVDEDAIQVAMVGPEGFVGCQALLGIDAGMFVASVLQVPGPASRISLDDLRMVLAVCPVFQELCMSAVRAMMEQTMQTAVCGARNTISERCVRWLLMAHDRTDGDEIFITHEALSRMLGVRRSGVTVVASGLQDAGLVHVSRGRITILDRAGLEHQARRMQWTVSSNPLHSCAALAQIPSGSTQCCEMLEAA